MIQKYAVLYIKTKSPKISHMKSRSYVKQAIEK